MDMVLIDLKNCFFTNSKHQDKQTRTRIHNSIVLQIGMAINQCISNANQAE